MKLFPTFLSVVCLSCSLGSGYSFADEESDQEDELYGKLASESSLSFTAERYRHTQDTQSPDGLTQRVLTGELELKHRYDFNQEVLAFLGTSLIAERLAFSGSRSDEQDEWLELDQLSLQWTLPARHPAFIRVGRQYLEDDTGWWWGESVNAVTIFGHLDRLSYQASVARSVDTYRTNAPAGDPELDSIYWGIGTLHYELSDRTRIGAYLALRFDQSSTDRPGQSIDESRFDEQDDDLQWLGLEWEKNFSFSGDHELSFKANATAMTGTLSGPVVLEDESDDSESDLAESDDLVVTESDGSLQTVVGLFDYSVKAWAINTRLRWIPGFKPDHSIDLAYASGSGTGEGRMAGSETFQQTGLHSNDLLERGYGDILQPDLSNLHVVTFQLQGSLSQSAQYKLWHHRYFLDSLSDETLELDIDLELTGSSRKLGYETGLAIEYEMASGFSVELSYSRFVSGQGVDAELWKSIDYLEAGLSYEF